MPEVNTDGLHLALLAKMDTKVLSNCSWIIQSETLTTMQNVLTG